MRFVLVSAFLNVKYNEEDKVEVQAGTHLGVFPAVQMSELCVCLLFSFCLSTPPHSTLHSPTLSVSIWVSGNVFSVSSVVKSVKRGREEEKQFIEEEVLSINYIIFVMTHDLTLQLGSITVFI